MYRLQTGQRYYFCDITMDIVLSQQHLEQAMFAEDLNDSCTWCMYTIEEQNAYLKERVQEWYLWGDGTKILTFPYEVGSYETLPNFEWKYCEGRERPTQPNMD